MPANKLNRLRPWLEQRIGHTLTRSDHLVSTYISPVALKKLQKTQREVKGQLIGVAVDGTTHNGESFCIIVRWLCNETAKVKRRAISIKWYRASMINTEISAAIISDITQVALASLLDVLDLNVDSASPNIRSFNETLRVVLPYCDLDPCLPHTGCHTGEALVVPTIREFVKEYNQMVGKSNYAKVFFKEITGEAAFKNGGSIRWWVEEALVERSIFPYLENGKLLQWIEKLKQNELCKASAASMHAMLTNKRKFIILWLEAACVAHCGGPTAAAFTVLEGQDYEYVTGYPKLMEIYELLKNPLNSKLLAEIDKIATRAAELFGTNSSAPSAPAQAQEAPTSPAVDGDARLQALLNSPVDKLRVSIHKDFWNWDAEPDCGTCAGTILRWGSKADRKIVIHWDGNSQGRTETMLDPKDGSTYLLQPGLNFKLVGYTDGRPAPEAPVLPDTFLLAQSDLSSVAVLKARAEAIVGSSFNYFRDKIMTQRHHQVQRMQVSQIFDPLHAQCHPVTPLDADALEAFNFYRRPDLKVHIDGMKNELNKYNAAVKSIKPKADRLVPHRTDKSKLVDSWCIETWWFCNKGALPHSFRVLQAVLTHSPNSCAPEQLFSILNDSFDDDQENSLSDYMELSLQLQYDERS